MTAYRQGTSLDLNLLHTTSVRDVDDSDADPPGWPCAKSTVRTCKQTQAPGLMLLSGTPVAHAVRTMLPCRMRNPGPPMHLRTASTLRSSTPLMTERMRCR